MKSIMKKFLALVMVGVMTFGMVAMASPSPSAGSCSTTETVTVKTTPAEAALQAVKTQAAAVGMSSEEYINNVVTSAPGVENAESVGVPTGAYINGVKTNYSILMTKSTAQVATSAKTLGKKVLNVFGLRNKPNGSVQIALYMPTVKAGQKVAVYQLVNGKWVKCVSSVRAEHVDVVLEGNGPVAVIAN